MHQEQIARAIFDGTITNLSKVPLKTFTHAYNIFNKKITETLTSLQQKAKTPEISKKIRILAKKQDDINTMIVDAYFDKCRNDPSRAENICGLFLKRHPSLVDNFKNKTDENGLTFKHLIEAKESPLGVLRTNQAAVSRVSKELKENIDHVATHHKYFKIMKEIEGEVKKMRSIKTFSKDDIEADKENIKVPNILRDKSVNRSVLMIIFLFQTGYFLSIK